MKIENYKLKICAGFTLMELLMVIVIFTIILSISFYFFGGFGKKEALEKDVAGLTALIRNARLLSVTSKNSSVFGVHFESNRAVMFQGNSYKPNDINNSFFPFSSKVYLYGYSLNGGGVDIVFDRLTGNTLNYGKVTLSLKDNSASTSITILKTGVIQ